MTSVATHTQLMRSELTTTHAQSQGATEGTRRLHFSGEITRPSRFRIRAHVAPDKKSIKIALLYVHQAVIIGVARAYKTIAINTIYVLNMIY